MAMVRMKSRHPAHASLPRSSTTYYCAVTDQHALKRGPTSELVSVVRCTFPYELRMDRPIALLYARNGSP
eukprot:629955-Heterocapsa_arctica.AAC.1